MKHTPGPWHWVNPQTDEPYQDGDGYADLRTTEERDSYSGLLPAWILSVEEIREGWTRNGEESQALPNMRLIAAAPDLLEALKRQGDNMAFIINHVSMPEHWRDKFTKELDEDRQVICKVNGLGS